MTPFHYPVSQWQRIDADTIGVNFDLLACFDRRLRELDFGNRKELQLDLGFETYLHPFGKQFGFTRQGLNKVGLCRLAGIDAPERNTTAGKRLQQVVNLWLHLTPEWEIASLAKVKFSGRFVGTPIKPQTRFFAEDHGLHPSTHPDGSLARFLWDWNLVKAYDGGKRSRWTEEELGIVEELSVKLAQKIVNAKAIPENTP